MVTQWTETYEWSMTTGNGDIVQDGQMVTLMEQCIQHCAWYLTFKPVMETQQTNNPDFQLGDDGVIGGGSNDGDELKMSPGVGSVHGSNLENDKDIQWDLSDDEGVADSQIKPQLTSKHKRSPTLIEEELQEVV